MKVLVTGGAGFIGSAIVWKLNAAGIQDIIIVDHLAGSEKWKNLVGKRFEDYVEKDKFLSLLDDPSLKNKIDVIIHMGACTSTTETDATYMMENNYVYSKRLAQWALKNRKRFLYASSAATYGSGKDGYSDNDKVTPGLKPLNVYGYSKHAFDLWVLKNRLQKEFVGFKFFNVYGPNESHKDDMRSMVNKGYKQIKETGKIRLFKSHRPDYADGEQKRDFIYVKDTMELVYHFFKNPEMRGIFNIGTGYAQTWNALAEALFAALGKKPNIEYVDMPQSLRDKYQYFTEADLTKLKKAGTKHKFFTLKDAVKDYVGYLENGTYL
ncbi:MAG: ADP-glyceromanno-heptose 6-epimerase [Candidatus Omnitrophica bacterium]|nr:ADP-glyceromanno-heptose 6-epimerase [Candidatus Omnitrophota bacterium]